MKGDTSRVEIETFQRTKTRSLWEQSGHLKLSAGLSCESTDGRVCPESHNQDKAHDTMTNICQVKKSAGSQSCLPPLFLKSFHYPASKILNDEGGCKLASCGSFAQLRWLPVDLMSIY